LKLFPIAVIESSEVLYLCVNYCSKRVIQKIVELNPKSVVERDRVSRIFPIHRDIVHNRSDHGIRLLVELDPLAVQRYDCSGQTTMHLAFTRKRYKLAHHLM
jgi:hypothetical protein